MEPVWALNPQLKAWWDEGGNTVFFEASYTIASGYKGAGNRETWGEEAYYRGGESIGKSADGSAHSRYRSFKSRYEIKLLSDYLLKNDAAYAEVVQLAKQLSDEIEYDWANFSAYQGAEVIRTLGKQYAVCSGYSSEVMARALQLESVASVEEWAGANHSWNIINLIDGRMLYVDVTWFDNEHIDHETGKIIETPDYGWGNVTFDENVFNYANVGYGSRDFTHTYGKLINRAVK